MAGYVSFGLFLLVLSPAFGVENLLNIINHLHNTYGMDKHGKPGVSVQYALGISVPVHFCNQNAPLDQNFLSQDNANNVKNDMSSKERVYTGTQLIGARPKYQKQKADIHAEYLLLGALGATKPSHMQNLLNKPGGGCTVFFSMNSPCVEHCTSPTGPRSIIAGLEMFRSYIGPKAFAFRQVYRLDDPTKWEQSLQQLNQRIPVYRCETNECVKCITTENKVDPRCTAK